LLAQAVSNTNGIKYTNFMVQNGNAAVAGKRGLEAKERQAKHLILRGPSRVPPTIASPWQWFA